MKKRKTLIKRRNHDALVELDITSLLDILVILLVFLLSAYSASELDLHLVDNLTLPPSQSQTLGTTSAVVQVDRNRRIWVDKKNIGKISIKSKSKRIDTLYEVLNQKKNQENNLNFAIKNKSKQINIVLDQRLPYEVLHKVMHTSALVGFSEFKFIVEGHY